ncbi:MAG: heme o synthase [Pseudomonadota bacterium]
MSDATVNPSASSAADRRARDFHRARDYEPSFGDYFALLKPRVMSLVVFTALVGVLAAPSSLHWVEAFAALLFIAVGAGASGALNMWWDADIDAVMRRTAKRPIPSGRVDGQDALYIGVALSLLSAVMLWLTTNLLAAGLLAFTIFFYAVVYSMWLKRSTPQNIVIGGAAGAFPPMIGWVAVTGTLSIEAVLMFAIIFLWTPPHFWALALFMRNDYDNAGVPMLTVTHGRRSTRNHILVYSIIMALFAVGAAFTSLGGPFYLAVALIANAIWLRDAFRIWRRDEAAADSDDFSVEKGFFKFSLLYLFLHFGAIWVEAVLPAGAWGGW